MFRSFLTQSRKTIDLAATKYGYCTRPIRSNNRDFRAEINDVKLVGTLISDSFVLESGTKALTLRTGNSARYQTHIVRTRGFEDLKAGQRLYVAGRMSGQQFQIENEKNRERVVVLAQKIFVLDDQNESESDQTTPDRNQVDLVGNVATEILEKENHCIFKVATHYNRNAGVEGEDGPIGKTDFHTVFVFDANLLNVVKNLKVRDRVVIEGEIRHNTHTSADGKKMYSGFVVPKRIEKISRRERATEENDLDSQANN